MVDQKSLFERANDLSIRAIYGQGKTLEQSEQTFDNE